MRSDFSLNNIALFWFCLVSLHGDQIINVIVQYNDRSLPDNLLLARAPIITVWFDGTVILMFCYVWWLCMAINIY